MKEKWKKLVRSRMTYAVLMGLLAVGVAAAGASSLGGGSSQEQDPYLALEETASPVTYEADEEAAAVRQETVPQDTEVPDEETEDVYETAAEEENEAAAAGGTVTAEETEAEETEAETEENGEAESAEASSSDVLSFSEQDNLSWPVEGEILRGFSMDTTVYYSTLDAYKVSPAMLIQGEPGVSVSAAAEGIVKEIGTDTEIGKYVVMELGDGYELKYGQMDEVNVVEGELVDAGDVIGTLADPTRYYCVEGCNLWFGMTKDGTAVDPLDYLE